MQSFLTPLHFYSSPHSTLLITKMQSAARSTMSMIARRSTPMLRQAMMTSRPSMSNSAAFLLKTRYNQQMQRTFVSPSFVAMMPGAADIDKSVQEITDLFMIARDEVQPLHFCIFSSPTPTTCSSNCKIALSRVAQTHNNIVFSLSTRKKLVDRSITMTTRRLPALLSRSVWIHTMCCSRIVARTRSWTFSARSDSRSWNSRASSMH